MAVETAKDAAKSSYSTRVWIVDVAKARLLEMRCRSSCKRSEGGFKNVDAFHEKRFDVYREFEAAHSSIMSYYQKSDNLVEVENMLKFKVDAEKLRRLERRMTQK